MHVQALFTAVQNGKVYALQKPPIVQIHLHLLIQDSSINSIILAQIMMQGCWGMLLKVDVCGQEYNFNRK